MVEVIRHSANKDKETSQRKVFNHSLFSVVRSGDELYHHGVKGQRWGVTHEDKPNGRDRKTVTSGSGVNRRGEGLGTGPVGSGSISVTRSTNGGHPYYSPSVGNAASYQSVNRSKKNTDVGKNTSISTRKEYTTPDLSKDSYSNSSGIFFPVTIGNTSRGVEFGINSDNLKNIYDTGRSVESYIRGAVLGQLESLRFNGEKIYLTEDQIDLIIFKLVHEAQKWKANYYKK